MTGEAAEAEQRTDADWRRKVKALLEAGELEGAHAAAAEGARQWPEDFAICNDLAQVLHRLGRCGEAVEVARQLTQRWPERAMAWGTLIRALNGTKSYDEAERAIGHARATWPEIELFAEAEARAALRRGDWDRALRTAEELEATVPDRPGHRRIAIQALLSAGRPDDAESTAAAAVAQWPDDAALAALHVRCANARQDWSEAVRRAERGVARWPDSLAARQLLVRAAVAAVKWPTGFVPPLPEARALAHRYPDRPQAWCSLLRALIVSGGLRAATRICAAARRKWPDEPLIAFHCERVAAVQRAFSAIEAAQCFGDDPQTGVQKARLLLRLRRPGEAAQLARDLIRRHPDAADVRSVHAAALVQDQQWDEALASLKDTFSRTGGVALVDGLWGLLFKVARQGRFHECLKILTRMHASAHGAQRLEMKLNIVRHFFDNGFFVRARRMLERIKSPDKTRSLIHTRMQYQFHRTVAHQMDAAAMGGRLANQLVDVATFCMMVQDWPQARQLIERIGGTGGFEYHVLALAYCMARPDLDGIKPHIGAVRHAALSDARALMFLGFTLRNRALRERLFAPAEAAEAAKLTRAGRRDHHVRYRELKAHVAALRQTLASQRRDAAESKISLVCPVHRIGDLETLTSSIKKQRPENLEAIVCFNNCDFAAASHRLRQLMEGSPVPFVALDCGAVPLGRSLNIGMSSATGDILCKFDADDLYLPGYVDRIRLYHASLDADVTTQQDFFLLQEETNTLVLLSPLAVGDYGMTCTQFGTGTAFSIKKDVWRQVRFEDDLTRSEDVSFLGRCQALGYNVLLCDPFDHVVIRRGVESHTWKRPPLLLMDAGDYVLGDRRCLWMAKSEP